ncbi:hypothetical protein [Aureimonas sp. ME7]|uniref:hypothetical protein n=1 Tax=Aureimonas sp. ME7 TaxID=2744252 RepID=UPI0015F36CC8|nr:hypothetical protein [Aureimonas sp. ME7]
MNAPFPSDTALTSAQLLARVATELAALAQLVRDLPSPGGSLDAAALAKAQDQDLAEQTLRELSAFLHASAPHFDAETRRDLSGPLSEVRLAKLAQSLTGCLAATPETSGDIDFF